MNDRIEKSIDLKAPLARVWRALTDHREFSVWFRVKLETPFVVGEVTRGTITYPGFEHLVMEAKVAALEPRRYFAYSWHPAAVQADQNYAQEPSTLVEFTLEAIDSGTRLRVMESGFDRLPAHRREEAWRMNDGGWSEQLRNIEAHVAA